MGTSKPTIYAIASPATGLMDTIGNNAEVDTATTVEAAISAKSKIVRSFRLMPALAAAIMAVGICGCKPDNSIMPEPDEPPVDSEPVDVYPVAGGGHDIYTGPNYRYGPSIIINDDNSIDIWLAAPGGYYGDNLTLYTTDAQEAVQLGTSQTFAQKFTMGEPFGFISLQCPSWSSSEEGFSLNLYKWNGDYSTTVGGSPVASKVFVNYADNSWLSLYSSSDEDFTKTFPAGTYLWVMDGGTAKSGIWKCPDTASPQGADVVSFINGEETTGQFHCRITSEGSGDYYWDKITWRHSADGGETWTDEVDALLPSDGRRDAFSVCDPGVAKWGGYYYIAYTSTEEPDGFDNDLYIARGESPVGPWEKWSGGAWGDDPQPVIDYTPHIGYEGKAFGIGEPCIVVKDGVIYLYYSWNDWLVEKNRQGTTTKVAIASADDSDWPAHLEDKGIALEKSDIPDPDHTDVKYVERSRKFIAIHAEQRNKDFSRIRVWESEDGIVFTKGGTISGDLRSGVINAGMSGDGYGHVRSGVQQYLCYAHSDAPRTWGRWNTWFQKLDWLPKESSPEE